ncbi:FKBP-type peptidyl-prolyl cis-trans isomerase [Lysobacter korlensis]|uniref:peptidylprolyl isomerase n=1 Tax=Lysobacter korlensis TaxID=553636 RepID=A0ABV6RZV1_9GAMM
MRSRLALILAAGVAAASLAGCGAQAQPEPEETASAAECTPSGEASDAIEVSEELGAKPTVTFEAPLEFSETQRTVVVEGDGEQAEAGAAVEAELTLIDASSGDELITTEHDGSQPVAVTLDETWPPGFVKALTCATVGTRVVTTITPEDGYGSAGNPQLGVAADAPLVLVADLVSIPEPPLARADGEPQELPEDFPAVEVVLAEDGAPTVTVPDEEPPAELQIGVLQKGAGAPVAEGDNVTVHYVGVDWATGEIFDESWANGAPATFNTAGVVPGFSAALIGQTVGSQVVAVLPPDQAYGDDPEAHELGGKTLVFVVDILAAS